MMFYKNRIFFNNKEMAYEIKRGCDSTPKAMGVKQRSTIRRSGLPRKFK